MQAKSEREQPRGESVIDAHLGEWVDALLEKIERAKMLEAEISLLKTQVKDAAKELGVKNIAGKTAKATISDSDLVTITYKELKAFLKARGQSKLLPDLVSVKVGPFQTIFGKVAAGAVDIGKVTPLPYHSITVTKK